MCIVIWDLESEAACFRADQSGTAGVQTTKCISRSQRWNFYASSWISWGTCPPVRQNHSLGVADARGCDTASGAANVCACVCWED